MHLLSKDAFKGIVKEMLVKKNRHEAIVISFTATRFPVAKIALRFGGWFKDLNNLNALGKRFVSPGKHNSPTSS